MRIVGVLLVLLGALGLGWQGGGCSPPGKGLEVGSGEGARVLWVPPLVSGIAVVSGLLLLASAGRREGP